MADIGFVRTEMLPEQAPPASSVGVIGWMRANLFSSWFNAILTIVSLTAIWYVLSVTLAWAIAPTWQAGSLSECRGILHELGREGDSGACWGVIRDRWVQMLFGFYPADLYWRPILAFVLLGVALAPVLFADKVPTRLIWFTALYPFLMPWLLWGGSVWAPLLVIAGFVLGYALLRIISSWFGSLIGIILASAGVVLWFLLGMGFVNDGINKTIGKIRIDSAAQALQLQIPFLEADKANLEARIEALEDYIEAALEQSDGALEQGGGAYRRSITDIAPKRGELKSARIELALLKSAVFDSQTLLRHIGELPDLEASLPDLNARAEEMRLSLPDVVSKITTENGFEALKTRISEEEPDISLEIMRALEDTLDAEAKAASARATIDKTYTEVARIGFRPVGSRKFGGMMLSITIGVVAIACSLPLGILLALGRKSDLFIIKALCVGFIEFIRGVPLITLLFVAVTLLQIFMPPRTNFDIILRVIIMATLFASAYMAEVIRGGLAALPKGQYEAADSLGLDYWRAQRLIIMPQALKISIPGIVSTFIGLFKDTTLVSIIGLLDPLGLSNSIRANPSWNGILWELYGFIALMFFVFCFAMSRYSMYLERKLQTDSH